MNNDLKPKASYMRRKELRAYFGDVCRQTTYNYQKNPAFPQPVYMDGICLGFVTEEIDAFNVAMKQARGGET